MWSLKRVVRSLRTILLSPRYFSNPLLSNTRTISVTAAIAKESNLSSIVILSVHISIAIHACIHFGPCSSCDHQCIKSDQGAIDHALSGNWSHAISQSVHHLHAYDLIRSFPCRGGCCGLL